MRARHLLPLPQLLAGTAALLLAHPLAQGQDPAAAPGTSLLDQVSPAPAAPAPEQVAPPAAAPTPYIAVTRAQDPTAQAEAARQDLRDILAARKKWTTGKKFPPSTAVTLEILQPYLPADSYPLAHAGQDRFGHPIELGTVSGGLRVPTETIRDAGQTLDFWGDFVSSAAKQSLAQEMLGELKQIRLAILKRDADAAGATGGEDLTFGALKGFLPEDSALWLRAGTDLVGNSYVIGTPKDPVHVSAASAKALGQPNGFWGEFAPKSSGTVTRRAPSPEPERTFGRKVKDFFKGR